MIGFEKDRIKIGIAGQIIIKRNRRSWQSIAGRSRTNKDKAGQKTGQIRNEQDRTIEQDKTGL